MPISFHQPPELFQSGPHGMSQVATVRGRMVIVSGQVALDADGQIVGEGDFEAQAVRVFENLKAALAAAGAGLGDVARLGAFLADRKYLGTYRDVRMRYLSEPYPASTGIIAQLIMPELLIEVEALAVLPED